MKKELTILDSARLIELGVDASIASSKTIIVEKAGLCGRWESEVPIFTLSDIISIMPKEIIINGKTENLNIVMDNYGTLVGYPLFHKTHGAAFVKTELIDALNQLLIWAIENNHVNLNMEKK